MNAEVSGIVLLNKPPGITSFKSLGSVKRKAGHGKVGHAGTLDKFAEGLLIVAVGSTTKLLSLFESLQKSYRGTIELGKTTDTLDPEGDVLREAPVPDYDTIVKSLEKFRGVIQQVPPVYSALHIDGRRASEMARKGKIPEMKAREVTISRLEILDWQPPFLTVEVDCSKGTYIRSLAGDIGVASGSAAYLSALIRTGVGPFRLEDAVDPDEFDPARDLRKPEWFFRRIPGISIATVAKGYEKKVADGVPFREEWLETVGSSKDGEEAEMARALNSGEAPGTEEQNDRLGLFDTDGRFIAFLHREQKGGKWKYRMVRPGVSQ